MTGYDFVKYKNVCVWPELLLAITFLILKLRIAIGWASLCMVFILRIVSMKRSCKTLSISWMEGLVNIVLVHILCADLIQVLQNRDHWEVKWVLFSSSFFFLFWWEGRGCFVVFPRIFTVFYLLFNPLCLI